MACFGRAAQQTPGLTPDQRASHQLGKTKNRPALKSLPRRQANLAAGEITLGAAPVPNGSPVAADPDENLQNTENQLRMPYDWHGHPSNPIKDCIQVGENKAPHLAKTCALLKKRPTSRGCL
jgi:hypothetical protein